MTDFPKLIIHYGASICSGEKNNCKEIPEDLFTQFNTFFELTSHCNRKGYERTKLRLDILCSGQVARGTEPRVN